MQQSLAGPVAERGSPLGFLAVGCAAGVFSGLLGIGGAAILVPGMVWLMGMRQHVATGTSLMVIIPTAAISAGVYALNGQVDWRAVVVYSLSSSVGAIIGAKLMLRLSPTALRKAFGLFLIIVALRMLFGG